MPPPPGNGHECDGSGPVSLMLPAREDERPTYVPTTRRVALASPFLQRQLASSVSEAGNPPVVRLPEDVTENVLPLVLEFLGRASDKSAGRSDAWVTHWLDDEAARTLMIPLLVAARQLELHLLVHVASGIVTRYIRQESPEYVRDMLRLGGQEEAAEAGDMNTVTVGDAAASALSSDSSGLAVDYEPGDSYCLVDTQDITPPTRQAFVAMADEAAKDCYNCKLQFSLFTRRHHCRFCGKVFCHRCCGKFVHLPEDERVRREAIVKKTTWSWLASQVLTAATQGSLAPMVRICVTCDYKRNKNQKTRLTRQVFELCQLEIPDLRRAQRVSLDWEEAALQCLENIFMMQLKLPIEQLDDRDCMLLRANRQHFRGHSRWTVLAIRSVDWTKPLVADTEVRALLELVDAPRCFTCQDLGCVASCHEQLTDEDALELLTGFNPVQHQCLRDHLALKFSHTPLVRLRCFLPALVDSLRLDAVPHQSKLFAVLVHHACSSMELCNDLYWQLFSRQGHGGSTYARLRDHLLVSVTAELGMASAHTLLRGHDVVDIMALAAQLAAANPKHADIHEQVRKAMQARHLFDSPVPHPVRPDLTVTSLEPASIVQHSSAAKPISMNFLCSSAPTAPAAAAAAPFHAHAHAAECELEPAAAAPSLSASVCGASSRTAVAASMHCPGKAIRVAFKPEDLRKDQIAVALVRLMGDILLQEKLDMPLVHYNVQPTSMKDGLVEFVSNAETVYDIMKRESLSTFLTNNNQNEKTKDYQGKFARSLAGYSVIMFLLGVGDRHTENLMVTKDGRFFHIDFGFILGEDPKGDRLKPAIPVFTDLFQGFGGKNSLFFAEYKELAVRAYQCLRKHANIIVALLLLVPTAEPRIEFVRRREELEADLKIRFAVGQSDKEAEEMFLSFLEMDADARFWWINRLHEIPKAQARFTQMANSFFKKM